MNNISNPFEYKPDSRAEKLADQVTKPIYILVTLITVIILMAGTFSYTAYQHSIDKLNLQLGSELRLHAFEISRHSAQASTAVVTAFPLLQAADYRYDEIVNMFDTGEESIGLPKLDADARNQLNKIKQIWPDITQASNVILQEEGIIRMMKEFIIALNDLMPELQAEFSKSIDILRKGNNNQNAIYYLGQLNLLTEQINNHANRILIESNDSEQLIKKLQKDTRRFSELFLSLTGKKRHDKIKKINNRSALKLLTGSELQFETWQELTTRVVETAPQLVAAQKAASNVYTHTEELLLSTNSLLNSFTKMQESRSIGNFVGYSLGIIALALLLSLGLSITRSTRQRLRKETEQNKRTENAILSLLDELAPLADGDLTGQATVSEEITGAIADAINYVVDELRTTVAQITNMARTVSERAHDTQATTMQLAQASSRQTDQIITVTDKIASITDAIDSISHNANQSTDVARQSVEQAGHGAIAVSNTIESMATLQGNIKNTSSTIKRLGESSQEIGDIVAIIQDIAEQTNILALNAAIHAHNSGQSDSEFSNLSEDIHQLADKVSDSTRKIENLTRTIQADTQRAVESMERNTSSINETMKLATQTGNALLQIEQVNQNLAVLINGISNAANSMKQDAHEVNDKMIKTKQFTQQNLAGTRHSAKLTGELTELANEQEKTAARFRLPENYHASDSTEQ